MENVHGFFDSVWFDVLKSVIATCALVAMATPNKYDNTVLQFIRGVVDVAALNFGNATNGKRK